ncbi:MAG TPA: hypothetical protein VMB82_12705, partial [Acidimicrobiales bacterium]|nr:hypothetical protein [Acidimicrobiales bacterium]
MIRKLLVIAAAVAMPATMLAGVTAISGPSIATAKAYPPVTETCAETGTVKFNKPGLSYDGNYTNKTTSTTQAEVVPAATDPSCSVKPIKQKITVANDTCASTESTPGDPSTSTVGACQTEPGKFLTTKPYYDNTSGDFESAGGSDLASALVNGINTSDNGTKINLAYGSAV